MANRRPKTNEEDKTPTHLIISKESFKDRLEKRIIEGQQIMNSQIQTRADLEKAQQKFYSWDDYNSELLKQSFNNESNEYRYNYNQVNSFYNFLGGDDLNEVEEFIDKTQNKIDFLNQLITKIDLMKAESINRPELEKTTNNLHLYNDSIFIVHGHNSEIKINVARILEKFDLNPIILHEQPNAGKTIIEKFEEHSNVGFAIILLTDDDFGKSKKEGNLNLRARQNVILELGYFIGKLGRKRVCSLYTNGVELPSDLHGLLYLEIDNLEHWKIGLSKELKAAGYKIDLNKII